MSRNNTFLAVPLWGGIICIFFLWMSFSALKAAQSYGAVQPPPRVFNPFLNTSSHAQKALLPQAEEMRERLEYMVFPEEREEAQRILAENLQRQINLDPFDGALWRDLTYAYEGQSVSSQEQTWVFEQSLNSLKWHYTQRAYLLNRCVVNYEVYKSVDSSLCSEMFENIPMRDHLGALQSRMGLDIKILKEVMAKDGVDLAEGETQ